MNIELARMRHLSMIPGIEQAAATMFPEDFLPPRIRFEVTPATTLREAQAASRLWAATTQRGKLVGFAMADIVDGRAHLDEINVVPEFGQRGIGTQLVHKAISWAIDGGFAELTLVTFRDLPWNAPFYEKLGFATMQQSELGEELRGLLEEEAAAGIDVTRRVCMRLELHSARAAWQ